ncbi:MAG: FAD-binding oxidoreductase [Methanomassiliicoccales archaeon]|nr:FAD-binding oxidoreductase [Methanomassiliicoccales archaeon]
MPGFRGRVLKDRRSIAPYSKDMSGLRIEPSCVAIPDDEPDVEPLFAYAARSGVPITPRGAGSNQSGSAVGTGMIAAMLKLNHVSADVAETVRTGAGAIHAQVDEALRKKGRILAYDPSSRTFCTIGGNVATKASGLRGLKYGSVDRWLVSARFFCPAFGMVDTRKPPMEMERAIEGLRDEARSDRDVSSFVARRKGLKSSSGYNLGALFGRDEPGEIAAHLLCGSVGTLGLITEVELRTIPLPKERALLLVFAGSLEDAIEAGLRIRPLRPSALELMDAIGLDQMRRAGIDVVSDAQAVLMVEFDEDVEEGVELATDEAIRSGLEVRKLGTEDEALNAWKVREAMLLQIKKNIETPTTVVPPFVEDLAVPPDRLLDFSMKVLDVFRDENLKPVVYGHAGEGNLHFRLPIPIADQVKLVQRLGDECVRIALSFGGTVTAEHGSGRLRLRYADKEFGRPVLELFDRVKSVFDPKGLLNPGVMPSAVEAQQ